MLKIQSPKAQPSSVHPILNLGFRIFFSGGSIFAILIMVLWAMVLMGKTNLNIERINPFYWHAHEMLFGYAMAVIAGFLLTAVKTWTGVQMPYGYRLLGIFGCWFTARLSWMMLALGEGSETVWLGLAMLFDLLFMFAVAYPIIKAVLSVKQYRQMGIISKLILLTFANGLGYWGIINHEPDYLRISVYLGLYLVVGVVLTIGRRVVPLFIERGLNADSTMDNRTEIKVKNSKTLDLLSLVSFLALMCFDIFYPNPIMVSISASLVAVINLARLQGWYHPKLWQKPLLWSLFVSFLGMCISFILFAIQPWQSLYFSNSSIINITHSIAVHALALSAIGMMTVAMMARVSLGHTGRSIHNPPKSVPFMFALMIVVFLFRVFMPIIANDLYITWIIIAQVAWIACFGLFCVTYLPILAKPRIDNLFG